MRFALGAKCGSPIGGNISEDPVLNKSLTSNDPNATLPRPRLSLPRKCLRVMFNLFSKNSFAMKFIFMIPTSIPLSSSVATLLSSFGSLLNNSVAVYPDTELAEVKGLHFCTGLILFTKPHPPPPSPKGKERFCISFVIFCSSTSTMNLLSALIILSEYY